MDSILSGLVDLVFVNVMHYDPAKEIWDKLQSTMKEMKR